MIWMNERNLLRVAELTSGATGKYRCWRHTEVEVETPCTFKGRRLPLGRPGAPPHHRHPPELPPQDIPPPLFVFLSLLFFFSFFISLLLLLFSLFLKKLSTNFDIIWLTATLSLSLSLYFLSIWKFYDCFYVFPLEIQLKTLYFVLNSIRIQTLVWNHWLWCIIVLTWWMNHQFLYVKTQIGIGNWNWVRNSKRNWPSIPISKPFSMVNVEFSTAAVPDWVSNIFGLMQKNIDEFTC